MAKSKKEQKANEDIEKAARMAAREAIDEVKNSDVFSFGNDESTFSENNDSEDAGAEKDVFVDAWKKSHEEHNEACHFNIYKNSNWIALEHYPFSLPKLLKKYGPGYYKIQAKTVASNKYVMHQSVGVGDLSSDASIKEETHQENQNSSHGQPDPYAMITMMQQVGEKAESKATQAAQAQANSMAMIMQTMLQTQAAQSTAQAQASQQFQTMILELNKQAQAQAQSQQTMMMTLMTQMFSAKKSDDGGFTPAKVMELVANASRDAETKTKNWFELIDKKAEALAEEKLEAMQAGNDEGDESLTKTIVKGFLPILGEIAAKGGFQPQGNQQQLQQPTPEQIQKHNEQVIQQQLAHDRARKAIEEKRRQAMPQTIVEKKPANGAAGIHTVTPAQPPKPVQSETVLEARPVAEVQNPKEVLLNPKDVVESDRGNTVTEIQQQIYKEVELDIAQALLMRKDAAKTADLCIKKLEKKGIAQQTVINAFKLEDFYALGKAANLPDAAHPWLKGFYDQLQKQPTKTANGVSRTRTRSGESAKNI